MAKTSPKAPKISKSQQQAEVLLTAMRAARDAGQYPLTVEQLATRANRAADKEMFSVLGGAAMKTAVVLVAKVPASPVVLVENLDRLAESDLLMLFAAETVRAKRLPKGKMRGDAKSFLAAAGLKGDLKERFQAVFSRREKAGTLPAEMADLIEESPEKIAARLLKVIGSQRNASANSYPVAQGRLLKLAECDAASKATKDALKLPQFTTAVLVCKAAGDGATSEPAYMLKADFETALPKLVNLAASLAAHAGKSKSTAFSAKELAPTLFGAKNNQSAFIAAVEGAASRRQLGGEFAWLWVKGVQYFFRRQDMEPSPVKPTAATPPAAESPAANAPAGFAEAFDAAFSRIDGRTGGWNMIGVFDLRQELPQFTREQFDAGLRELRRAQRYTMDSSQGGESRLTDQQRSACIQEGSSLLVYVSRR